jgi:sugar lactone lactonase YvrE
MKSHIFQLLFLAGVGIVSGFTSGIWAQTATPTFTLTPCCNPLPIGLTGMNQPAGLALNSSGTTVYVADTNNQALRVFAATGGNPITTVTVFNAGATFGDLVDLALDNGGNIYASDLGNGNIDKFGSDLSFIASFGVNNPTGVWVDDQGKTQSVYVTSTVGNVFRFDGSGASYAAAATFGGSTLNAPGGIVKTGNLVLVADSNNSRIVGFDASNHYAAAVTFSAPGPSFVPYGIRTDLAGYFYVTSSDGYLRVFRPDFVFDHACNLGFSLWGVGVNSSGINYISEYSGAAVTTIQGCVSEPTVTPSPSYTGPNPPGQGQCFIFPSPVRGDHASVSYYMAEPGQINLRIWTQNRELASTVMDSRPAGNQATSFSLSGFSPGVYFYILTLNYASGKSENLGPKKFAVIH